MNREANLNFDEIIDRRNTDCLKYDFAVERGMPADILPLWVADMDFRTSAFVLEALQKKCEHGIFGYSEGKDSYFQAVASWMERHHNWKVKREWLLKTPGVVFALAMAVKAYTKPGDAVLIQQPVYYPFSEVIADNERQVISSDLLRDEQGRYHMDFEDLEEKLKNYHVSLLFLCSPHNPVGRVWTREELRRLGDLCLKYHVLVVADEIHEDFAFGEHKHTVFASIRKEYEDITITCTSPGKTFNLAGLQVSNIFIADETLRRAFRKQISAAGYSQLNAMGLAACEAAYDKGDAWYDAMKAYVYDNYRYVRSFLQENLPQIRLGELEGTYLIWLDFRGLGLDHDQLEALIVKKAGLWLDSGSIFGETGEGFQRINIACPRRTLEQALTRLKEAVDEG